MDDVNPLTHTEAAQKSGPAQSSPATTEEPHETVLVNTDDLVRALTIKRLKIALTWSDHHHFAPWKTGENTVQV